MASTHWPDVGAWLEVAGIDQVHAPRPGHAAVDHDDLAVQTKIVSRDDGLQQTDRQGGLYLDARLAEPLGLPASPPGPGADRVDQYPAGDAPPAGANQGLEHLVGGPALVPDVELHQHALAGVVDVLGDGPQDLLRLRMELGHAAGHGRNADQAGAQPVHAAGLRPMLVPRDLRQPPIDHVLGQLGIIAADRGDPPGTSQPDPPFADQQIEHKPDQGQEGDEEHPRQGDAAGRPPHDHPQGNPQHDGNVQEDQQRGKNNVHGIPI